MLRLRNFAAFLLIALWVPATLHCDFEAAGLDDLFHCAVDHHSSSADSTNVDTCDTVENGWMKRDVTPVVLTAPTLCACLFAFLPAPSAFPASPPAHAVTDEIAAPPELARTWQFVARAAPPPRAPSLAS